MCGNRCWFWKNWMGSELLKTEDSNNNIIWWLQKRWGQLNLLPGTQCGRSSLETQPTDLTPKCFRYTIVNIESNAIIDKMITKHSAENI